MADKDIRLHHQMAMGEGAPGYKDEGGGGSAHGFKKGGKIRHEEQHEAPEHGLREHVHDHTGHSHHTSHDGHVHHVKARR